ASRSGDLAGVVLAYDQRPPQGIEVDELPAGSSRHGLAPMTGRDAVLRTIDRHECLARIVPGSAVAGRVQDAVQTTHGVVGVVGDVAVLVGDRGDPAIVVDHRLLADRVWLVGRCRVDNGLRDAPLPGFEPGLVSVAVGDRRNAAWRATRVVAESRLQ